MMTTMMLLPSRRILYVDVHKIMLERTLEWHDLVDHVEYTLHLDYSSREFLVSTTAVPFAVALLVVVVPATTTTSHLAVPSLVVAVASGAATAAADGIAAAAAAGDDDRGCGVVETT